MPFSLLWARIVLWPDNGVTWVSSHAWAVTERARVCVPARGMCNIGKTDLRGTVLKFVKKRLLSYEVFS